MGTGNKKIKFVRNNDEESQVEEIVVKSGEEKLMKPLMFIGIYCFTSDFCR